jgi:serine protease AprX
MTMIHRLARVSAAVLATVALFPGAVAAQIQTAKLDETLRESVAQGCVGTQSVIISVEPGYREGLRQTLAAHGDVVTGEFPALNAVAATVHCADLMALASFGSTRAVSTNAPVGVSAAKPKDNRTNHAAERAILARDAEGKLAKDLATNNFASLGATKFRDIKPNSLMLIEADAGLTDAVNGTAFGAPVPTTIAGYGIGVAVIDSGIEPGTDFDDRITAFYDFTNGDIRAVAPHDDYGHGTHVAGLIGSEFVGVAPYARLIGLKVLNSRGQGTTDNVVRAIEFAIANRYLLGINVLNLSLGHPIYEHAATDPLVQAVEHAAHVGMTVVVAAGNFGENPKTGVAGYAGIVSPANAPSALTAGAVNTFETVTRDDDRVAPYSSRGPSWYDGFAKPNVVAPGHNLLSVAANGSFLRKRQERGGNKGNYMRLSGTSMAAGVTSGVAAVVLQANHRLTPNALKAVLEYTSIPVSKADGHRYDPLSQGTGQIQTEGAVALAQLIDPHAAVGTPWLASAFTPSTLIGTQVYTWSQSIIWGNRRVAGTTLLSEQRPAWGNAIIWGEGLGDEDDNIVWGNNFGDDDNVVWGNSFDDDDNIVWGNNIVWANDDDNIVWGNLADDDDNIVWGNLFDDDDNIVWGSDIVWGNALIGFSIDDDNIVWGNDGDDDDNIVWGNLDDDNIVWGNLYDDNIVSGNNGDDDDNIVWGNLLDDDDNVVWGNSSRLGSIMRWGGGTVGGSRGHARRTSRR